MSFLKDVAEVPGYDAAASAHSKSTIFMFIGTFVYMVFNAGFSPGFIGGTLFFIVGIFAVSLVISAPISLTTIRWPKFRVLTSIFHVAITIYATIWMYEWLFG